MTIAIDLGSLALDSMVGVLMKYCVCGASNYSVLKSPGGVSYQVPAGKKFVITKIQTTSGTAGTALKMVYGDNAIVDAVTVPTNKVDLSERWYLQTAVQNYEIDTYLEIPAEKYAHVNGISASQFANIYGYEVDV